MIDTSFRTLMADYSRRSLLLADIPTGKILEEIPYPAVVRPAGITASPDGKAAYIPAAKDGGEGVLFALNLTIPSLYQLPLALPHPAAFTLSPDGRSAYAAGSDGTLHHYDLVGMKSAEWGRVTEDSQCAGLAVSREYVCAAWEHEEGGCLMIFSRQGILQTRHFFAGIPTSLHLADENSLLLTYTSESGCEGVLLYSLPLPLAEPADLVLRCGGCAKGLRVYPADAAFSPCRTLAYIVNEDSASLSIINLRQKAVSGCIAVGRSLSQIAVSGDGRFAAGASNAFADLCLIDLVNGRLLSFTDTPRELSGFIIAV